jgi:hypothetical protein
MDAADEPKKGVFYKMRKARDYRGQIQTETLPDFCRRIAAFEEGFSALVREVTRVAQQRGSDRARYFVPKTEHRRGEARQGCPCRKFQPAWPEAPNRAMSTGCSRS